MTGDVDADISPRTMPTTSKDGYTFDGWYANEQHTGDKVEQLPATFAWNADYASADGMTCTYTYYANFTANASTLVFDYGYTPDGADSNKTISVTKTTDFSTEACSELDAFRTNWPNVVSNADDPAQSEYAGRVFDGWYAADGTQLTALPATFPPVESTTYTARWVKAGYGTVSLVANGGSVTEGAWSSMENLTIEGESATKVSAFATDDFEAGCSRLCPLRNRCRATATNSPTGTTTRA